MAQHTLSVTIHDVQFTASVCNISIVGDESRTDAPLLHGFRRICLAGLQLNGFDNVNRLVNAVIRADRVGDFELYRFTTARPAVVNSIKKWLGVIQYYPEGALNIGADIQGTVSMVSVLPQRLIALMRDPELYKPTESELYLVVLRDDYLIPPVPPVRG